MKFGNVALDGSTERLIAAARATQMTESLPKESARTLLAAARGVRLYLEARQTKLAVQQLDVIDALMKTCDDYELCRAYGALIRDVRNAVGYPAARSGRAA